MITFLQDSLEKAAAGLEERISWLQGVMHVAFVGRRGEFDKLKHRLVKLPELKTRPHVIFNLLQVRKTIAEAYNGALGAASSAGPRAGSTGWAARWSRMRA